MNHKKEFSIRGILIILGILFVLYAFYSFYLLISPIIETLLDGELVLTIGLLDFTGTIIILIMGMILFFIGHHWDSSFKSLTITCVSIAAFIMTLAIFAYSFNSHSQEITDSIQPSLDLLIAQSLTLTLEQQLTQYENTQVTLLLSSSQETKRVYSENISIEDARMITEALGVEGLNDEQQISFANFLIETTYSSLQSDNPEFVDAPIPLSTLSEAAQSQGLDLNLISGDVIDLLGAFVEANENAYINLLILENEVRTTLNLGDLTQEEIELVWLNFGFNTPKISTKTKELYIVLILGATAQELQNSGLDDLALPVASLSSQVPEEVESFLSYDLATENLTQKSQILPSIREDCLGVESETAGQICSAILLSDYDYLMENLDTIPTLTGLEVPEEIITTLEPFSSTEKIESNLEEKTSYWKTLFTLSIFLFIVSHLTYLAHFKIFKRDLIPAHIPYFISKQNLIHIIFPFIFLLILYYFVSSGLLIDVIGGILPEELGVDVSLLFELEIFKVLISIFSQAVFLNIIYIIISIIIFAGWYFLLKKRVEAYDMGN